MKLYFEPQGIGFVCSIKKGNEIYGASNTCTIVKIRYLIAANDMFTLYFFSGIYLGSALYRHLVCWMPFSARFLALAEAKIEMIEAKLNQTNFYPAKKAECLIKHDTKTHDKT